MGDQKLAIRDQVLLTRLVLAAASRGVHPWVIVEGRTLRAGVEGRGELRTRLELVRMSPEWFLDFLVGFAKGVGVVNQEIEVIVGDGCFPEEGWTERERSWLAFQVWRAKRGEFSADGWPIQGPEAPEDW